MTRFHKNIKLVFGLYSDEQRQPQKLDIRFNSPAVVVCSRHKFCTAPSPLLFQLNWWKKHCKSQSRSPDTSESRVLTTSGLGKKKKKVKIRGVTEQAQETEWNLLSCLILLLFPSIQAGTWIPSRLQLTQAQSRPVLELREKIALSAHLIFFSFISNEVWMLYRGLRLKTEHLFWRLEAQHTRENWII